MDGWIVVKNVAGQIVGPGPILTASNWTAGASIDESAPVSFDMPASDVRWQLVQSNSICEHYGIVNGVVTLLGAGIAETVETVIGDPSMKHISGFDLLHELARYPVGDQKIVAVAWGYLNGNKGAVKQLSPAWSYDAHFTSGVYCDAWDLAAAYDGNKVSGETPATDPNTVTHKVTLSGTQNGLNATQYYLYVGADALFEQIQVTLGGTVGNTVATLKAQYFNGTGWAGLTILDYTNPGGKPFSADGPIRFTRPTDWDRVEASNGAGNWFWVRLYLEGNNTELTCTLREIEVYGDQPTTSGVALITAIAHTANASWEIVSTATATAAYMEFSGGSVLEALISLREKTGGHFRLDTDPAHPRRIVWMGAASTWASCGYRAIGGVTGIGAEGNPDAVLITACTQTKDASEIVARIIPFAGSGATRIDLAATTRVAPAGYTLNKYPSSPAQPYLENDAAMMVCFVAKDIHFDDISQQQKDSWYQHPSYAADSLFDAALTFLKTHCVEAYHYTLTVTGLRALLIPGTTIPVAYQEWTDGVKTVDINTYPSSPLYIMGVTRSADDNGALVCKINVSNVERQPETGTQAIVNTIQTVDEVTTATGKTTITNSYNVIHNDIVSNNTSITGGQIDGTQIGTKLPATGIFSSLLSTGRTWLSNYTVMGGEMVVVMAEGILPVALANSATTLDFGRPMTVDDYVMIRSIYQNPYEYIRIGALVSGTIYNITRGTDGSTPLNWPANSVWLLLGHSGDGRMSMRADGYPKFRVYEQGATADDNTVKVVLGNITGMAGVAGTQWGLWTENGYFTGVVTASSGAIGGWVIGAADLHDFAGVVGMSSAVVGAGDIRFWAGHATPSSAPFRVTKEGALVATSATITGAITATSGTIGSFTIGTYLYTGTKTAYNDANAGVHLGSDGIGIGNNIFTVSAAGALVATSATITGAVTATSGAIGGWVIGAADLHDFAGVVGMSSAVTGGDDIRFWAGHATPGSAPFRVTEAGALVATSATISGAITATSGTIGGFTVTANELYAGAAATRVEMQAAGGFWAGATAIGDAPFSVTPAGLLKATSGTVGGWTLAATTLTGTNAVLTNTGVLTLGTGNDVAILSAADATYRLWLGNATAASAPFSVTKAGVLAATSGAIGGWTIGATTLQNVTATVGILLDAGNRLVKVGDTDGAYVLIDGVNGTVGSSAFSSGVAGWRVGQDGNAEFNNIVARGVIRTPVFLKDEVFSIGGSFLISDSDVLKADCTTAAAVGSNFTFVVPRAYFAANDYLRCKPDETREFWALVVSRAGAAGAYTYTVTLKSGDGNVVFRAGEAIVNYGADTLGLIMLTATLTNSPHMSIFTHGTAPWTTITERVRLGNLTGITDPLFGNLSGYGLWTDNGYFSGSIKASVGAIGGWVIGAADLHDFAGVVGMSSAVTGGDDIRFWAGHATPGSAPFRVTEAGALVATSATISGAITATSGTIGGFTVTANELYAGAAATRVEMQAAGGFWAGATAFADAPFRVSPAGVLVANSATITGAITASSGSIGGWTIGATYLYTAMVGLAPADYPFYAGVLYAARSIAPFRVGLNGALTATNATISGAITAKSGSITGTLTMGANGAITVDTDAVVIDANGITLDAPGAYSSTSYLKWNNGATAAARIGANNYGTDCFLELSALAIAAKSTEARLGAYAPTTNYAEVSMIADSNGHSLELQLWRNDDDGVANKLSLVRYEPSTYTTLFNIDALTGDITTTGNVGIGTTTPAGKLHLLNPAGTNAYLDLVWDNANTGYASRFLFKEATVDKAVIQYNNSAFAAGRSGNIEITNLAGNIDFRTGAGTGTSKMYILNTGNVGIRTTTPTARLHLPAGSATAGTSPLKLTSGTVLGTPEPGAIEYDGTHFYGTDSGGTRRQLDN